MRRKTLWQIECLLDKKINTALQDRSNWHNLIGSLWEKATSVKADNEHDDILIRNTYQKILSEMMCEYTKDDQAYSHIERQIQKSIEISWRGQH